MPGSELLGLRYEPPFPYISDYGEKGHTVLAGDFVSVEDGTGVVHTGAAFGEDDFRLATDNGLTIQNPVRPDGTFDERAGPFAGMYVRDADAPIVEALRESGRLFRGGRVRARLPALLALRHAAHLLRQAELVRAHDRQARTSCSPPTRRSTGTPTHIKHGRFGKWLENNVDWALSRERYWGTPLPIWRCAEDAEPRGLRRLARGDRASAAAPRPTTCTGPTSTRSCCAASSAAARCAACPT